MTGNESSQSLLYIISARPACFILLVHLIACAEALALERAGRSIDLDDFDESKLRYDRIISMTDADVDGAHIRILLYTFLFRYMRPLIEHGHVYAAKPPLYKATKGKEEAYLYSEEEKLEYALNNPGKVEYQRYKGLGEMSTEQLWNTTMNPATRTLIRVTMQDAAEADQMFAMLMGENPALRRQFIEENASLVTDLDV